MPFPALPVLWPAGKCQRLGAFAVAGTDLWSEVRVSSVTSPAPHDPANFAAPRVTRPDKENMYNRGFKLAYITGFLLPRSDPQITSGILE